MSNNPMDQLTLDDFRILMHPQLMQETHEDLLTMYEQMTVRLATLIENQVPVHDRQVREIVYALQCIDEVIRVSRPRQ